MHHLYSCSESLRSVLSALYTEEMCLVRKKWPIISTFSSFRFFLLYSITILPVLFSVCFVFDFKAKREEKKNQAASYVKLFRGIVFLYKIAGLTF